MIKNENIIKIFTGLTVGLSESTPESNLYAQIKSHILSESDSSFLSKLAFAMNYLNNIEQINESTIGATFQNYVKLAEFVKENSLRFPLEETLIEELIKLQEDDGAGVGSSGPGSVSAPAGPIATNNTSGVAKLDYPLGEKPKRKKEDASDISSS